MNARAVWIVGLIGALIALACPSWANARALRIDAPLCHAVTSSTAPDNRATTLSYGCTGEPSGYQDRSLWLHVDLGQIAADPRSVVILVHQTRFKALTLFFTYADGRTVRQGVRSGDFGSLWRVGGQVVFEAPGRDVPLSSVTLRLDHLSSHKLLRTRLLTREAAGGEATLAAALIGAAMTLLLVGAIYNLSLAVAIRRQFLAWHGLWAATMFVWGLFWSQLALPVLPGMAGTAAAQTCTFLACLAVAAATASAITSLGRATLPRGIRIAVLALGTTEALLGVPASLITGASIDLIATILAVTTLSILIAVAGCIAWAWRRGSSEARDFALAWSLPMATLGATQLFDMSDILFGGGAQIAVLFAAALQTVWLSVAATRRLAALRRERDSARAAESALSELASRDPLTGLLNRRGFVARTETLLQAVEGGPVAPFGLLLIDIDHFKTINDEFGHETGDQVLHRIAGRLRRWESESCAVGRLGGEEFVLAIRGLDGFALARFAESVRGALAACHHRESGVDRRVTASIGVVQARPGSVFEDLYGLADQALYRAKHAGRDRVVVHRIEDDTDAAVILTRTAT